jgi:serine protease DegQ
MMMRRLLLMVAVAVAIASGCTDTTADTETGADTETEAATEPVDFDPDEYVGVDALPDLVELVQPTIVSIEVGEPGWAGEGSGVIVDESGIVVTNEHVVRGMDEVSVALADGDVLTGRVVATDTLTDLALVEIDRDGLPAAQIASELPRVGERVLAIGSPLGFASSVTAGIISGHHRQVPSGGLTPALVDLLQTDAALSPGSSGGGLFSMSGELVGINIAFIPPQADAVSIGFAVPGPTVEDVVDSLRDDGSVEHAFLGITPGPLTGPVAQQFDIPVDEGVVVLEVSSGTGAARAGIRTGDIVVGFDGEQIDSVEDLYSTLRDYDAGDLVEVEIIRDDERLVLEVELEPRP